MMLIRYIRQQVKYIVLFVVFMAVFSSIAILSGLDINDCVYAVGVCLFIGMVFSILDFYLFYKKYKELESLRISILNAEPDFNNTGNLIENEYMQIIMLIRSELFGVMSQINSERTDMKDYYTMWVHQIKTPIAALDLIIQSSATDNKSEMKLELKKINNYVEMVLQYIRMTGDYTDFMFKKYSLDDIIREAVKKNSLVFIKKKLKLEYEPVNMSVITDDKWLGFVIEQILSNALKYTSKGKIKIYTDRTNDSTLVIEDTGIGIRKEDIPRVFEHGFTGYNGHDDKKSTGIGLYLCNKIVGKLGNTISIESEIGEGTKVSINLSKRDDRLAE